MYFKCKLQAQNLIKKRDTIYKKKKNPRKNTQKKNAVKNLVQYNKK